MIYNTVHGCIHIDGSIHLRYVQTVVCSDCVFIRVYLNSSNTSILNYIFFYRLLNVALTREHFRFRCTCDNDK